MGKTLAVRVRVTLAMIFTACLALFGSYILTTTAYADELESISFDVPYEEAIQDHPAQADGYVYRMFNGAMTKVETRGLESIANLPLETDEVIIYRIINNSTGEHLYSSQYNEVIRLIDGPWSPWRLEGVCWNAPTWGEGVYRLYNPYSTEHLYTKDAHEVTALSEAGWDVDNGWQPLFYSGGPGNVYRLYNPYTGAHLLTTDANEYAQRAADGWNQEGVGLQCASVPDPVPSADEIYRRAMAVYSTYPEGSIWPDWSWGQSSRYYTQGEWYQGYRVNGGTCYGFALLMSDAVFGTGDGYVRYDTWNVRPGDIIHYPGHYAFVMKVEGTRLTCVDGNWDYYGQVHWGRQMDISDKAIDEIWSRY